MQRNKLVEKLMAYHPESEDEKEFKTSFLTFIKENSDCFKRSHLQGHITGSAWIVNASKTKTLLTHHNKLDKWLQLGGHADGDADLIRVATKEAEEESGLLSLQMVGEDIFDIDIHTIPERVDIPEHLHYDIRFLFEADETEPLKISNESKALAWVALEQLESYTNSNASILRMAAKTVKKERVSSKRDPVQP